MKATVAAIVLTLTAAQANAEGFYQMVVGNAPQADRGTASQVHRDDFSPLYDRVTRESRKLANGEVRTRTLIADADFTPLYRQVRGS
jgi:hypothetical protein